MGHRSKGTEIREYKLTIDHSLQERVRSSLDSTDGLVVEHSHVPPHRDRRTSQGENSIRHVLLPKMADEVDRTEDLQRLQRGLCLLVGVCKRSRGPRNRLSTKETRDPNNNPRFQSNFYVRCPDSLRQYPQQGERVLWSGDLMISILGTRDCTKDVTYTSLGAVSSTHLPIASACHFNIFSATSNASCPSSSLTNSSLGLSGFFSAVMPPNRMNAAAA